MSTASLPTAILATKMSGLLYTALLLCYSLNNQNGNVEAFSVRPTTSTTAAATATATATATLGRRNNIIGSFLDHRRSRFETSLCYAIDDEDDEDEYDDFDEDDDDEEDDDDDYIDTQSLGDWRSFRRNLSMNESGGISSVETKQERKIVSKENEELLLSQNKELAEEYMTGVWAHPIATPEVGGLVVRMPMEVEIFRNYRHSMIGKKLRTLLDGEDTEVGIWYARAKRLVEDEMSKIAQEADDEGQIDASQLSDEFSELLGQFLENQETWQEVCLVADRNEDDTTLLVLNRPMAFKLTENLGRLCLFGAFQKTGKDGNSIVTGDNTKLKPRSQKDLVRFMMAFSSECAVYVGGPDEQGEPAKMIHGIADLPGAREISPGSRIYEGGIDAAVRGVLDGKYSPLEFRFFIGCHIYEGSALDVAVHLGKYQPVACARSLALKQCISLPKPLWNEVMELCGGELEDISTLEMMNRDEMQFQVLDETDYDEEMYDELAGDDDDDDLYF